MAGFLCLLTAMAALTASALTAWAEPLSFDPATGIVRGTLKLTVLADGKLLALDASGNPDEPRPRPLVRFNADGSVDEKFQPGNLRFWSIYAICPLADGQVLIAGELASSADGTAASQALVKLNADGTLDAAFAPGPEEYSDKLVVLPDGKLLLSGYTRLDDGSFRSVLSRLNSDGTRDGQFDAGSAVDPLKDCTVYVQNDGKLVLSLNGGSSPSTLLRTNADGTIDPSFAPATFPPGTFTSVLLLPDGKIVAAYSSGDDDTNTLFRFNADGTPDLTFHPPASFDDWIRTLALLPDGGLIVAGDFTVADLADRAGLARLGADGTLDPAYNPLDGAIGIASSVVVGPAGDVFVALTGVPSDDPSLSEGLLVDHFALDGTLLGSIPVSTSYDCSLVFRPEADSVFIAATGPIIQSTLTLPVGGTDDGFSPPAATGVVLVRDTPVVTITAATPKTFSGTRNPGEFIVERTGADYSKRLRVVYRVSGSAVAGQDYRSLRGVRIIQPGQRTARIRVRPIGEQFARVSIGRVDVTVKLASRPGYKKGEHHAARVKIIDRESLLQHHG
jgi:uncharacterized delta-60 repeat protein